MTVVTNMHKTCHIMILKVSC